MQLTVDRFVIEKRPLLVNFVCTRPIFKTTLFLNWASLVKCWQYKNKLINYLKPQSCGHRGSSNIQCTTHKKLNIRPFRRSPGKFFSLSSLLDVFRRSLISSLRVAASPLPPPPPRLKRRRRSVYANCVPWRHSNLCKIMSFDNIFLRSGTC